MEDNFRNAIKQMQNGEESGFNAVYSATYNRVYFRAKQLMKREEDAQDLTQIVFIEAYKNIHTLKAEDAIYSWLDGITYNQGMKLYRKRKDVLLTEEAEKGIFEALESQDVSTLPELTADQKATAEIIRGIIEELPELQKSAVIAYYFDGFKVEQIADMMECSVNTIKSRLNYARKYIRDRVEEKERKEGYKLHAVGLPLLWYAIRSLAEGTTLTAQAAQNVYNGACVSVGLQATAISGAGVAAGTTTAASATAPTVAGGTVQGAGIGAKLTSLTTTAKVMLIAGAVALVGAGTAGVVTVLKDTQTVVTTGAESQSNIAPIPDESVFIPTESASITEETNPKTLADMDLSDYEVWETEDGSGSTLYVREIGSESVPLLGEIMLTTVEYEGYWTLDGQEIHYTGKDCDVLEMTDLEGNPIDRRVSFYYLTENGMVFVDVPDTEDWKTYAFRDVPDYIYKRASDLTSDNEMPEPATNVETSVSPVNTGMTWQVSETVTVQYVDTVFIVSGEGDMPDYTPWIAEVVDAFPTAIIVEEGITSIPDRAFSGYQNVTEVSLPSTLKTIGDYAFSSCSSLKKFVVPDGVEKIGEKVFFNGCIKEIVIPASVTEIGDALFMSGYYDVVIYGEKGSVAERYAKKYEKTFIEQ